MAFSLGTLGLFPIKVYSKTERNLNAYEPLNFSIWHQKVDLSNMIEELEYDSEEFPASEWQTIADFGEWVREKFASYPDGTYYLYTRMLFFYPLLKRSRTKLKRGRMRYAYSADRKLRYYGRPYRQTMWHWSCIARFEMFRGGVLNIAEKQSKRKYPPYRKPYYPLIKILKEREKLLLG